MNHRQAERFRAAAIIYSNPEFGGSVADALVKADTLLALVEADGDPIDGPAQIRKEIDADSRMITVYPCPRCGESDRDGNAASLQQVIDMAKDAGWDGMDPLLDWLELQIDRATMYMDGEDAVVHRISDLTDRAKKAEAGLARTGNLIATAIRYSAGQASWQALEDAVMRYEREVQG